MDIKIEAKSGRLFNALFMLVFVSAVPSLRTLSADMGPGHELTPSQIDEVIPTNEPFDPQYNVQVKEVPGTEDDEYPANTANTHLATTQNPINHNPTTAVRVSIDISANQHNLEINFSNITDVDGDAIALNFTYLGNVIGNNWDSNTKILSVTVDLLEGQTAEIVATASDLRADGTPRGGRAVQVVTLVGKP